MTEPQNPVIVINGKEYPGPAVDDLSFDELEIAERYGAPIPKDGDEPDLRHVRWLKALVAIALTRADEDTSELGALKVNQVEFRGYEQLGDAGPPPNRAARRATGAAKPVRLAR